MTKLSGPTYHIRRELRRMGARYTNGAWWVPTERAGEAQALLSVGLARKNAARRKR